jgi:hypothetical protein
VAVKGYRRLRRISKRSHADGLVKRAGGVALWRHVLLVLLLGLVGATGLAQNPGAVRVVAVLSVILGVAFVLDDLRIHKQDIAFALGRAATPPPGIFISYRRDDTGPYARLLQVYLQESVPHAPVFVDLDSIEAGTDFTEAIRSELRSCRVLVALVGPRWLTLTDEKGLRRLDDPDDYLRLEIRTALENRLRVIPVLVDGAKMPKQQDLPADLCNLARLNALEMCYGRYAYDSSRLAVAIQKALAAEKVR